MGDISNLQKILLDKKSTTSNVEGPNPQSNPYKGIDPLLLAYMMILKSVQINYQSANLEAKTLQVNAKEQDMMINQEQQLSFITFKWSQLWTHEQICSSSKGCYTKTVAKKLSATLLEKVDTENQEISAQRGIMEDQINLLRQNAQIQSTNLNTTAQSSQQTVQEGSSIMQMLTSLTNQISRI